MALSKIDVANMLTGLVPNDNTIRRPNAQPIIINSDMAVAQRGTSFTGVSSGSNFPVDRFEFYPTNLGAYTIIQEALTSGEAYNNGFRTALRIDTTTADASPAATDYAILRTKFEGQDLQLFKKGTSNAEKFTLAFWVKSNKTTTGQVNLFDIDNNRLVSGTYTISSANTWEKKVINFPADTTGAFDNNNALSLVVEFFLDGGSNFTGGTAPTAWEAQTNADRNANNFAIGSSTDNDFAITGIQLEVGEFTSSTLPPFQHESFGDNLARCERYCLQLEHDMTGGNETQVCFGWAYNTSSAYGFRDFAVQMRTQPTMSSANGTNYFRIHTNNTADLFDTLGFNASSKRGFWVNKTGLSGLDTNQIHTVEMVNSNAYVRADAEL